MTGTTSPEQSLLDLAQFEAMAYSRQHQQAFSAAVHILDSLNNTYAKIDQVARQTLSFRARKDSADGETVLV